MGDAGFGSGVIISSSGYVLTNNHVINNENLEAILSYQYELDGYEEYVHSIEVIKQDKVKDLALIKIHNPRTALSSIKISRKVPCYWLTSSCNRASRFRSMDIYHWIHQPDKRGV